MKKNFLAYAKSWYIQLLFWSLLLDFMTKQWAASIQVNQSVIDGFFYLAYSRNTGAAWSILSGNQWMLALISLTVGISLGYYYLKNFQSFSLWNHVAINLFLSGTWGNFIDRAFFSEGVIDFLSFHFGDYIFPTFNVADSALTIGVIILIAASLFERPTK